MIEALIQIDHGRKWLHLREPVRVIEVWRPDEVDEALREVERLTRDRGYHAAGFLTYEAGAAFGLSVSAPDGTLPPAWFALFDRAQVTEVDGPAASGSYDIGPLTPAVDLPAFERAFTTIRHHISSGNTYQVNYTFELTGRFSGEARDLFADLVATQRGRYSNFVQMGTHSICCASPELFFARHGAEITTRPMKGTARRGRTTVEDDACARELRASAKERAENVMIVDMMRNDLGRIAATGSVAVPELFAVERYPTIWQMTSTVTARSEAALPEIFAALHPSASVTGAPKIRTMEIIADLERRPRGIYTGSIGYVAQDGTAQFSVAIRTAVIDHASATVRFGVGSGIVWDSSAASEYQECLLKAAILGRRPQTFDLLETMKWTPDGGFFLLDRHLHRLERSARYFDYPCSTPDTRRALDRAVATSASPLRVRVLLARDGTVRIECAPLEPTTAPARLGIAPAPIDPTDVFLFHKTTNRTQYDQAKRASTGVDDVILWNPDGQVTESTLGNVVAEIGRRKVTPPVACGLLAGTFREQLLEEGVIEEGSITIDELRAASRVWLVNSVREWWPAVLVEDYADRSAGLQPRRVWQA